MTGDATWLAHLIECQGKNPGWIISSKVLKYSSQPFTMPFKLLILLDETKSYCFTVSCFPESMFNYLSSFTIIPFLLTCSK